MQAIKSWDERIESYPNRQAFITLKDHKEDFINRPKCRLINPAKPEIGKISKHHLDEINSAIRSKTKLNQWRSTASVISWFMNVPHKPSSRFLKFDIVSFYPSISEALIKKAIDFAQKFVGVKQETVDIIMHCRKSLLFTGQNAWIKQNNPNFDVTPHLSIKLR